MQRVSTFVKRAGETTAKCEKTLARSFAEVPRANPPKATAAVIPRKAVSSQRVTTQMSNKYAYPIFGVAGIVTGLTIYEAFRCVKSENSFMDQLKEDFVSLKGKLLGIVADGSISQVLGISPCPTGPDGKPVRTVIINFGGALTAEEWNKEFGERYIKRPGVDKLLMYLSTMFDLHIIIEKDRFSGEELLCNLDTNRVCNYMLRDNMVHEKSLYLKDISYYDRDPKRVIIIDIDKSHTVQTENVLLIKPFDKNNHGKDTTLIDIIPILEEIFIEDVEDVRELLSQLGDQDAINGYRNLIKKREEDAKEDRQKAFLQQINVFKPTSSNDEESGNSLILADPEIEGLSPALAATDRNAMIESNRGMLQSTGAKSDHLKYIPVDMNGEKPEGFTTYWQREYVKKKEGMMEQQMKMLEMQATMMKDMEMQQ